VLLAFIGLAFKELSQAIEKCFRDDFAKMDDFGSDSFWSALQAAVSHLALLSPFIVDEEKSHRRKLTE